MTNAERRLIASAEADRILEEQGYGIVEEKVEIDEVSKEIFNKFELSISGAVKEETGYGEVLDDTKRLKKLVADLFGVALSDIQIFNIGYEEGV